MSERFKSLQKTMRRDFIFLGVLSIIIDLFNMNITDLLYFPIIFFLFFLLAFPDEIKFESLKNYFSFFLPNISPNIFNILYAVLLFVCAYCAWKGKSFVGILGIIIGVLMILPILNHDIIDAVLGIILLSHSIKYLRNFPKKENAN